MPLRVAEDTRKMLQAMGNTVDNTEVGMVTPTAEDQNWMLIFEYDDAGYIKDDDKDKIDKDAILESYRKGTEEANKRRKESGIPGLHIIGWFEEPHYDARTHNLVWALRAKDDGGDEVVNYNVRLLGRKGYMSVTLVDDPARLAESKPHVDALLSTFEYKKGRTLRGVGARRQGGRVRSRRPGGGRRRCGGGEDGPLRVARQADRQGRQGDHPPRDRHRRGPEEAVHQGRARLIGRPR